MKERCSCGAKFEIQRGGSTTWTDEGFKRILETLKDWRENHRHDMPAPEATQDEHTEAPHIFESAGASVERSYLEHDWDRPLVTVGFRRNEVR